MRAKRRPEGLALALNEMLADVEFAFEQTEGKPSEERVQMLLEAIPSRRSSQHFKWVLQDARDFAPEWSDRALRLFKEMGPRFGKLSKKLSAVVVSTNWEKVRVYSDTIYPGDVPTGRMSERHAMKEFSLVAHIAHELAKKLKAPPATEG